MSAPACCLSTARAVQSVVQFSRQQYHRLVPGRASGPNTGKNIYRVDDTSRYTGRYLLNWIKTRVRQLFHADMESQAASETVFAPPEAVRGMKSLNQDLFVRTVKVPCLRVESKSISALSKRLKISMLKVPHIRPVAELSQDDPASKTHRLFLLDPRKYTKISDIPQEEIDKLKQFDIDVTDLSFYDVDLKYDNWTAAEVLRAVLPAEVEGVSGYSIIGHIAHLNLKPEVMEYKHLIGQVILDKNRTVKTVVNKLNTIDNTFRNFQMELLAGEDNYVTRTKENGCTFELDFSKVYWNPRLSTEHQRVVDWLKKGDVLYDVFAGIGPFAIPSAKKGVHVLANDLNPHSHAALVNNVKLNKVAAGLVQTYNLDGREFIHTVLKKDLVSRFQSVSGILGEPDRAEQPTTAMRTDVESSSGGHIAQTMDTARSKEDQSSVENIPSVSALHASGDQRTEENVADGDGLCSASCTASKSDKPSIPTSAETPSPACRSAIVMNLPALAMEFLDAFPCLLSDIPENLKTNQQVLSSLPTVFCYCFSKSDNPEEDVRSRAETILGRELPADSTVRLVRNVAPNKEMMCLIFRLSPQVLFGHGEKGAESESLQIEKKTQGEPASKRLKVC